MIDERKLLEKIERLQQIVFKYNFNVAHVCGNLLCEIKDFINEQLKVGEWILVKDRLPNEEEFEKYYCRNHYAAEFIVMIKGANKPTSLYYKEGIWFDDDNNDYDVIAWRPLPEPYSSGD